MFTLLAYAASLTLAWLAYTQARNFVRSRLRFVPAAQSGWAPILAGLATAIVSLPIVGLIPLIGAGTAISVGLSVGLGVANGQRDIRRNLPTVF
ncbi:MAG: hypothetical protein V4813_15655 [Gemmatimonadota bacterium]